MPKATPAALPFDPAMPHALALPFPGAWAAVQIVYDLAQVESYLDAEPVYMADSLAAKRTLDARAGEIAALPDGADKPAALRTWAAALHAWERADALRQIAYFVVRVEWPHSAPPPDPTDPDAWSAWPLVVLKWIVTPGWTEARAVLYDPKRRIGSSPAEPPGPS